jgi:hypothetical protein
LSRRRGMFQNLSPNVKAALLTIAATVFLALFAGFYKIGYDFGAKDLEAVNDFRKANLPAIMKDMRELARDFHDRASLAAENERLIKDNADRTSEIKALNGEISKSKSEAASLKTQVERLQSELDKVLTNNTQLIEVTQNDAARVIPNRITIGVVTVYDSFVDVRVNGYQRNMSVGEKYTDTTGDGACTVELMRISKPSAHFAVSCSRKAP